MIWPLRVALEEKVVECLKEWIKLQGPLESLRADSAHNISGKLVEKFCKENRIILVKSIAYRPETNGISECVIRSVKEWFAKNRNLGEWDTGAITGSNTVELENNGIQSNKDLLKK